MTISFIHLKTPTDKHGVKGGFYYLPATRAKKIYLIYYVLCDIYYLDKVALYDSSIEKIIKLIKL